MKVEEKFVGFDALKRSVTMAQVLDRYHLLDRLHRSGDSLTGACPIHAGHNQTQFRVSLSKNCWICFGDCHGGGSILDFVSRKEDVGLREAGLMLQDWFNLAPGSNGNGASFGPRQRNPARVSAPDHHENRNPLLRFTLDRLDRDHAYLRTRGLSAETMAMFGLGHCSRGIFAGWIAIPIHNAQGQLVAYAGRWPGEPARNVPKYKFPKGFRKSLEVFNLHRAALAEADQPLVVVEGFFGCMMVCQAGYQRVVSIMGSMLSQAQESLVTDAVGARGKVILLFDEDEAGRKGRTEARARLSRSVETTIVRLGAERMQPDHLPPAELLALLH